MKLKFLSALLVVSAAVSVFAARAQAAPNCDPNQTTVPGHCDKTGDVSGHYTQVYYYDGLGRYLIVSSTGATSGNVGSIEELDPNTLSACDYVVNYHGNFGGDPYLDSGAIINSINCYGPLDNNHYMYMIVDSTNPRFRGNPDWSIWGNWEYHNLGESHTGNLVRPFTHVNP